MTEEKKQETNFTEVKNVIEDFAKVLCEMTPEERQQTYFYARGIKDARLSDKKTA